VSLGFPAVLRRSLSKDQGFIMYWAHPQTSIYSWSLTLWGICWTNCWDRTCHSRGSRDFLHPSTIDIVLPPSSLMLEKTNRSSTSNSVKLYNPWVPLRWHSWTHLLNWDRWSCSYEHSRFLSWGNLRYLQWMGSILRIDIETSILW
jgi:hypothetical protein